MVHSVSCQWFGKPAPVYPPYWLFAVYIILVTDHVLIEVTEKLKIRSKNKVAVLPSALSTEACLFQSIFQGPLSEDGLWQLTLCQQGENNKIDTYQKHRALVNN